jgi:hypothetical protein
MLTAVGAGVFTVQFGSGGGAPAVPTPLVSHGDDWRYRPGTNAPQPDWKTAADGSLDGTWLTGPGGFGYEDNDDATVLTNMINRYSTLYIRQEFQVPVTPDTNQQLRLIMDWDDGFVAWLDGTEIARSSNAPGAPGTEPAFNAISLAPNHEASAGAGGSPPTVYNLGRAADWLAAGTHVLAVMGLNGATNSSDFSLIADLEMIDASTGTNPVSNAHYTLVPTSPVSLSGSNTVAGSARVTVNGVDAVFSIAEGTWHLSQPLSPGMNRLFIAALDAAGNILFATNRDVVLEASTTFAGGVLASSTTWSGAVVRVTNHVSVPSGMALAVDSGVVVLISPGMNVTAAAGGSIAVNGTEAAPVFVLPTGNLAWGNFGANGSNASVTVRHAETVFGQLRVANAGTLSIEDSVVRDLPENREIIAGVGGADLTVRRSYIAGFAEVDAQDTPVLIEHSLLERFLVDGVDIKATNAPLIVRASTLRYGNPTNSNADAVDFGPGAGTVERCLIHHFPDKGVSIGGAPGTHVSGSLIFNCGIGISAYSSSGLVLVNNTIADCDNGILFRNNPTPAVGTATNLIVWGNLNNIVLTNTSTLSVSYSDVQGGFTGTSNINSDPLFENPSVRDYRLGAGSPARNTGLGGVDMGAVFPVGGIPAAPAMLAGHSSLGSVRLSWQEDADNEEAFLIERSPDGSAWTIVGSASANSVEFSDNTVVANTRYFYRVAATNISGKSRYSNIASASASGTPVTETFVGGTLTENTTWTPAMGMIIVRSNIIVPTNIVLTMLEGTLVKVTNGVSIRATAGGTINVLGSESNKVVVSRWNTNAAWGEISANGTNASIYIRFADISGGQTTVYNAAVGLLEDSYFHHYRISGTTLTQPIVLSQFARLMTMRRSHVQAYYETLFRNGIIVIEDCLFEDISGDGLDFDAAQAGTVLRRSTFRNGTLGNVDAIDVGNAELGGSRDVIIEDCMMYNFPFDKGVSVGDSGQSTGTVVRNCLMYGLLSGVQAKDGCIVTVYNCTIVDNAWGFTNYNKVNPGSATGGGHTVAWNNILWDNTITLSLWNSGTLTAWNNDLGNTNWPGTGNINVDPLFLDPDARDYRLAPTSPCIGAGSNGVAMGVTFPVGGLPAEPMNLVVVTNFGAQVLLAWNDASWNESGFLIEASTNGANWTVIGATAANSSNALATTTAGIRFRVKGTNFIGASFASNVASITGTPGDLDGDGMPDSWESMHGFNPADPADASQDADSDGMTNLAEFQAGTDPLSAASRLGFVSVTSPSAGQVELMFPAQTGKAYTIQYRDSLSTGSWQNLIDVPAEGSTRIYSFTDAVPIGVQTRFYRLLLAP